MTVPVTVPSVPPFTVTVFVPPLLVTVTVTDAPEDVTPVPNSKVAIVGMEADEPSVTVLPPVATSKAQGLTGIVVGATMPGIVELVILKMHEP